MQLVTDIDTMGFPAALALVRLTEWHARISEARFRTACEHSVNFGILAPEAPTAGWPHPLVAFCRVVTDRATYAYLCDVIVHPDWRGRGLAKALVVATQEHPDIRGVRRYALLTRHAAGLYRKLDFHGLDPAITYLELFRGLPPAETP